MKIIFLNYYFYQASSGVHIHFIANALTELGHECTVVLPTVENTNVFGEPRYSFMDHAQFGYAVANGMISRDTILHAWTPRENTRVPTLLGAQTLEIPYFVHLEDNERKILEAHYELPFDEIFTKILDGQLDISPIGIHPILHQTFIAEAAGITVLMDKLGEFVPPNVPTQLIWPACEKQFFRLPPQPNLRLRRKLGISDDTCVLVYPGNVHHVNKEIVSELYRALPLVEAAGHPVCLVRCAGADSFIFEDTRNIGKNFVISEPDLAPKKLPEWIWMADILVQPGVPSTFDEYRFPSKLPLFLASGRPVILARTNLGRFLEDGENCLILEDNTPETIASKIVWLLEHPEEKAKIGHNGRKFAAQNFNWQKTAKTLLDFYEEYGGKRG